MWYCRHSVRHSDSLAQNDDVQSDALLIPALRFCGQLATWTGNSTTDQVQKFSEYKFQTTACADYLHQRQTDLYQRNVFTSLS